MYKLSPIPLLFAVFFAVATFFLPYSAKAIENTKFESSTGVLSGKITNSITGQAVAFAYIHIDDINRAVTADREGMFTLVNIPIGKITIFIHRIGYEMSSFTVEIEEGIGQEDRHFELMPLHIGRDAVVVTDQRTVSGGRVEHASAKIQGQDLRRELSTTLAETLRDMPGIEQRSLGPASGRPIIRGMTGERVMILEDGFSTGDVSTVATDHAVTIDPMSAREVEIARGPSALAYTGNAVGGVINVIRDNIPTSIPNRLVGNVTLQGQTVSEQAAGSVQLRFPSGRGAFGVDLNGRLAGDFQTPSGTLTNSYIQTTSNTFSYSAIRPWGYAGTSANFYVSNYGIPPDPNGGHPNGVDIEMMRFQNTSRAERLLDHSFFTLAEAELGVTAYYHRELESNGSVGTEFAQNMAQFALRARHRGFGIIESGLAGLQLEAKDYRVAGSRTPNSQMFSAAVFAIQEMDYGRFHFELGNRLDLSLAVPESERMSEIGFIRSRSNAGVSSSAAVIYRLFNDIYAGSTMLLSYRSPSLEELYSEGPHLAAYTYEIGNPDLAAERGFTAEVFLRNRNRLADIELTAFRNFFWNYIYPRDTGIESNRFPGLNNFQFDEGEVLFYGLEASAKVRLNRSLSAGGNVSYVYAERRLDRAEREEFDTSDASVPLPLIPPFGGLLFTEFQINQFSVRPQWRFSAEQSRNDQFESETAAYSVFDVSATYIFSQRESGLLHTLSASVQNILNTEYRNHTSVIKDIFPEPGLNISLLYRLYF